MDNITLVLNAIKDVKEDVKRVDEKVTKVTDDHEKRLRSAEGAITRFKTIGSIITAAATFFGIDSAKHHWPF